MTPTIVATPSVVKHSVGDARDRLCDKRNVSDVRMRLMLLAAKKGDNYDDKPSFRGLSRATGLSETALQKLADKGTCHSVTLEKLAFVGINLTWLLTGVGNDGLDAITPEIEHALIAARVKRFAELKRRQRSSSQPRGTSGHHPIAKKKRD